MLLRCVVATVALSFPHNSWADEDGVSMWLPGLFGSLAAAPQQPGWTQATIYYHTTVSAGAEVARAREFSIGRLPVNLSANLNLNAKAQADLALSISTYVFATPVLGGQAAVGLLGVYGRNNVLLEGTLSAALTLPGGAVIPFSRSNSISNSVTGFGDLFPQFSLRWNNGVHNIMTYVTGDIPVGAYDATRLANIGIGHGAVDAGAGYTFFNPLTGQELSGVLGFTYNFENKSTQYQNGVDMHLDLAQSQFLTKQLQVGLVGYVYKQLSCDSGAGDLVGCFDSQVFGAGPQVGYVIPMGDLQGYVNLKGYKEFGAKNRPEGWNVWLTFVISPAPPTPGAPPMRMVRK